MVADVGKAEKLDAVDKDLLGTLLAAVLSAIEGIMDTKDKLEKAIEDMVEENPHAALVILAGHFVGLAEAIVEANGGHTSAGVRIEGQNGSRDITIHAKKELLQ